MKSAQNIPLVLSAKRKEFRDSDPHSGESDAEFSAIKAKIRERDDHTCRACGFHLKQGGLYMQVHHLNDDHGDNSPKNLATLCMHCHAPFHIGFWGQREGSVLVFLPEIQQWQISHLARLQMVVKYARDLEEREVAMAASQRSPMYKTQTPGGQAQQKIKALRKTEDTIDAIMARIRGREEDAIRLFKTSSPSELGEALTKLPEEAYRARHKHLEHLRLVLPPKIIEMGSDIMSPIVQKWFDKGGPFVGLPPLSWTKLMQSS